MSRLNKIYEGYFKAKNTIRSCNTLPQMDSADRYIELFKNCYQKLFPEAFDAEAHYTTAFSCPDYHRYTRLCSELHDLWNNRYDAIVDLNDLLIG